MAKARVLFRTAGAAVLAAGLWSSAWGSACELERADGTVRVRRAGEEAPFAEFRPGEASANCDIAVRTVPGSPFVFVDVTPKAGRVAVANLPRIALRGIDPKAWRAIGTGGLVGLDRTRGSYGFCALGDPKTRRGYVAAWLTDEWASGVVFFDANGVAGRAEYGPMVVPAGAEPRTDTFVFGAFDDVRLGLEAYADAVAAHYRIALPEPISGFCTWYCDKGGYGHPPDTGGAASEAETREFVAKAVELDLAKWGFGYYQIDDKWQGGMKERLGPRTLFDRVRENGPYPNGMKAAAECIRAGGFVAGLWYLPFSGDPVDPWWAERADLFVKNSESYPRGDGPYDIPQIAGKPFTTPFGSGSLDLSNPKTVEYVRETAARITGEWGFRLIKFDGMYAGMAVGLCRGDEYREEPMDRVVFADRGMSNVQAFRRGVRALRAGCAEGTRLLACNVKQSARGIAASYGLVDLLRIGGDNGPLDCSPHWYMAGPEDGSPRYFLNGRVWYNDPDPVYVRDAVPVGRARLMASWTSLGGLLYCFSDWLPRLSPERVEILKRTLAPHGHPKEVRPVDYLACATNGVWKLAVGDYAVYGLYNWGTNAAMKVDCDLAYADLDPARTYVGFDFWGNRFVGRIRGRFAFDVPADDCRVIAVRAFDGRAPVLVSTSRHVASSVIDVTGETWDAAAKTLSGRSKTVPGESYELRVWVPEGLRCVSAGVGKIVQDGSELRVSFADCPAALDWKLSF